MNAGPSPEVTGLISAIGYTEAVAAAHAAHGTTEAFTTALTVAEYGQAVVDAVAAARHASTDAAAAWTAAAAELGAALTVREAYVAVPDAGGKHHLLTDDASRDAPRSAPAAPARRATTTGRTAEMTPPDTPEPAAATASAASNDPAQDPADDSAEVPDVLGVADEQTIIGSDQVQGVGRVPTNLTLIDDPGGPPGDRYAWQGGQYVEVATPRPDKPGDQMVSPTLSPDEADQAAAALDDLADRADRGERPAKPSKWTRAARKLRDLMNSDQSDLKPGDRIWLGDDDTLPLTYKDLLGLLGQADPQAGDGTTPHRRVTYAAANAAAGGESCALWAELLPDGRIGVTGIEGTKETPDDEFWQPYTAHHTPDTARELAGKLRHFAAAARHRQEHRQDQAAAPAPVPTSATNGPADATDSAMGAGPAAVQPRRIRNARGEDTEYDPATGVSAVIQSDGWRAPMPASSPTAVGIRLLYMREEIKDGQGDGITDLAARTLLNRLTVSELREVAAEVGAPTSGARTRAQLADNIVRMCITSPRKHQGLRQG